MEILLPIQGRKQAEGRVQAEMPNRLYWTRRGESEEEGAIEAAWTV